MLALAVSAVSQVQKYHRIRIHTGKDGLARLAAEGLVPDHGEHKPGVFFTGEFSDAEVEMIKKSGLPYEVLISDMAEYYVQRNTRAGKQQGGNGCNDCRTYAVPNNFSLGTMGGFYKYAEMLAVLDSMAAKFPNLVSVRQPIDTALTFEGRPVWYVKISDNPSVNEAEPELLYTALHHAREPESLTQLIYYMWYLLENYSSDPEIAYLVDNLEMYFVPCLNPDGYMYNQTSNPNGGGMWRKNRRDNGDGTFGVDLNRNYGYQWGYDNTGSSPNTNSDTYRGPAPFSEKETQMIMRFCNAHTFQLALNNHTYSNVLVQPYGYAATAYTPDSLVFVDFGMKLSYCNGFSYGTAMQTVGYTANGGSDDWMYGEQTSKPKIYSMTPEAGSVDDGFWPMTSEIIPIAQNTMDQNINAARLVGAYAEVRDAGGPFLPQSGYLKYTIKRMGLQAATFTVSVMPLSGVFQSVGAAKVYAGLSHLQSLTDSISFSLVSGVTPGDAVQYLLRVNNGSYALTDTISCVYGTPVTIFADNCSATTQWSGGWGTSTQYAVSPTKSITDSPGADYAGGAYEQFSTVSNINLSTAVAAYLEYYARWELEKNWDFAEIMVSVNGGSYMPVCAPFTHSGNSYQDPGQPLYDGFQRYWVKERIDLSPYLGQNIQIAFLLVSDNAVEYDGFYFDDVKVRVIDTSSTGVAQQPARDLLFDVFPNPCAGKLTVRTAASGEQSTIRVADVLGNEVLRSRLAAGARETSLDLRSFAAGIYFVELQSGGLSRRARIALEK
jgi:carboxypeptidase T